MRFIALAIATLFLAVPGNAQNPTKGKSETAPGKAGTKSTPGLKQQKSDTKTGKDFAPGQNQKKPGGAKNINPGSTQRKK